MQEKLFKAILAEVMKIEYEDMTSEEVTRTAMSAVSAFATQNGVRHEWLILSN